MAIFLIYQNDKKTNSRLKVIEESPSITAGLFNFFWAIYKGFWPLAISIIVSTTIIHIIANEFVINIWHIILIVGISLFASEITEFSLKLKGYKFQNVICADSAETAELIHLARNLEKMNDTSI